MTPLSQSLIEAENKYVIVFFDGSDKWVLEKTAFQIYDAMAEGVKFFPLSQTDYITISSISKILSEEEYNQQYAKKLAKEEMVVCDRPIRDTYIAFDYKKIENANHIQQMIKGVKKFVLEKTDCSTAKETLKRMENRLKYLENK